MKVLFVDDCKVNLLLLRVLMGRTGYDFEFAENGLKALEKVLEGGFDLVFMDCMMPVMDGHTAIRAIRESGKEYSDIPIICMSSKHHEFSLGCEPMCRNCRVDGFLCKPFTEEALYDTIERYEKNCCVDYHEKV